MHQRRLRFGGELRMAHPRSRVSTPKSTLHYNRPHSDVGTDAPGRHEGRHSGIPLRCRIQCLLYHRSDRIVDDIAECLSLPQIVYFRHLDYLASTGTMGSFQLRRSLIHGRLLCRSMLSPPGRLTSGSCFSSPSRSSSKFKAWRYQLSEHVEARGFATAAAAAAADDAPTLPASVSQDQAPVAHSGY